MGTVRYLEGSENRRPEEWGEAYASKRRTYLGYTGALESLFRQLLEKEGIPYVQVDGRTKEVSNFVSKLRRKSYEDPLEEVTDFSGIRLVLYYLDDVERVGELIARQFSVDEGNSIDKGLVMDPDRFGYLSVHYVVQPSDARRDLPEWSEFADLWAEIQVRTVLQHAWGAISRKLAYASVREAPRDLQRSLNRLSALLELADEQFLDIREARDEIEQQYNREVERGNLELELDESSLESYIRESGLEDRVSALARAAGSNPVTDEPEQLMMKKKEGTKDLLTVLRSLGVERISQFDERLQGLWNDIPKFMSTVNERYTSQTGKSLSDLTMNWLVLILLWHSKTPAEEFKKFRYVDELIDAITSTYGSSA